MSRVATQPTRSPRPDNKHPTASSPVAPSCFSTPFTSTVAWKLTFGAFGTRATEKDLSAVVSEGQNCVMKRAATCAGERPSMSPAEYASASASCIVWGTGSE
ncbi:hypothetical protein GSI_12192 [Ganoderma sinense ZZ0214-1]|uniref:Uncharacterized protein n=1 Tax=Ganoderma sinense ZZ0214-1 TaxID=1077348 RepID=A0A2G8RY65_9APHY|nr:hypothetical protein GSI_12192 [Ganoderma sinense ZZ0214-1]